MKNNYRFLSERFPVTICFLLFLLNVGHTIDFSFERKKDATAQYDPQPVLFGAGVISTEDDESGITFTPDGKTCFFTKKTPSTIVSYVQVICFSHFENGKWSKPEIAPFSGRWRDFNPCISPDGEKLFFISNRPGGAKKTYDPDIWMVKKTNDGWSEPENLGAPVNTAGWELGCSIAKNGTLYFSSTGTTGNADLYSSKLVDGKYQQPDSLGEAVNTLYDEGALFIAPDESYLIFSSQGRPDAFVDAGASANYPRSDLYISFNKEGSWTTAKKLDEPVNSAAEESNPSVSADGKTFYFTSERNFVATPMHTKLTYSSLEQHLHGTQNGLGDIYEIPLPVIMKK